MRITNRILLLLGVALFAGVSLSFIVSGNQEGQDFNEKQSVYQVLKSLGEPSVLHEIEKVDPEKAKQGEMLVKEGYMMDKNGKKTSIQSKHFQCIHCHNVTIEDPDLANPTPEGRIKLASEKNIGFLQGTTMYGLVNRSSWYNGDYFKKYGDLVKPTRDTLINAVQLCATVCSQGRALEDWEMDNVLHYLWSIEFQMKDLGLSEGEKTSLASNSMANEEKRALIKSKYFQASPATFVDEIPEPERGLGKKGDAENGALLYKQGCMWCHNSQDGVTNLRLDDDKLSRRALANNLKKDNDYNLYHITREGTYPIVGYKPYMPHYTAERMSNQQIEDLASYLTSKSK